MDPTLRISLGRWWLSSPCSLRRTYRRSHSRSFAAWYMHGCQWTTMAKPQVCPKPNPNLTRTLIMSCLYMTISRSVDSDRYQNLSCAIVLELLVSNNCSIKSFPMRQGKGKGERESSQRPRREKGKRTPNEASTNNEA